MTVLSRLTKLGLAKESTYGTYVVPTVSVPWNTAKYTDVIDPLRDESIRANDTVLQGLIQGPANSTWEIETNGYGDLIGHWFVSMGLFDTTSAGVSTTLAANSSANATSLSLTATVPNNSILKISDAGGVNLEYVQVGTITGGGPYTAPITAGGGNNGNSTQFAHTAAGGSVTSQTTHTFKQNRAFATTWPSYSFTTDDGTEQRGWAGCVASEVTIKIDPKGFLTLGPKFAGFLSASQATFSYAASTLQATPGWAWTVTNAGGSSTRGLTMDFTLKRAQEIIHSSNGSQSPREIFPGALEIDGTYKAIFDSSADLNLYRNYTQTPTVHTLAQPVTFGGSNLAVTMTSSGYTTGEVNNSGVYVQLDQSVSGITNTTDGSSPSGVVAVVLKNFQTAAY